MDSAEYERKIAARFATFDQDGNGYIDREDFSAAARAVLAEFGTTARSEHGQAVFNGAEAFWQGLAGIADVDGDQRVTREEFVTGAVKRLRDNPQGFAEIARPFLHAVIAVAWDGAGAGPTREATARVLRVLGTAPDLAEAVARSLDADGDGRITEPEFLTAFATYCGVALPDA
ncbi:EF-hand domain-containing protein [Streptomyces sp. WAC06614]|uniref:EF-hand domain-containing protein n=1 Tax=Streptomyces sp. WAC06614 TaxID=2487416 RepID=UPI000F7A4F16|nr:EF-hand domain-containing protein [Streptomyces sp. WAC06614]RSS73980.1 EF-hand domain-containing protein [Streptomyces sp. WAC06614]